MGLSAKLVRSQLNFFKPFVASCSLEVTRKGQDKLGELMEVIHRHNVIVKDHPFEGFEGAWIIPKEERRSGVVLYLHGGGYTCGDLEYAKGFGSTLAAECGVRVFCAAYRLAPESPYPAAVDDAEESYRYLLSKGYTPQQITLCGESAGGGLIYALCLRLKEKSLPLPNGIIAISPWVDLTLSGESYETNRENDPSLTEELLRFYAECYAGDETNPEVSPLFGDLEGLPPSLIFVGGDEILLDDSRRMHEKLLQAGCKSRLVIAPERWHAYVLYMLNENMDDFATMNQFLTQVSSGGQKQQWMRLDNAAKIYPAAQVEQRFPPLRHAQRARRPRCAARRAGRDRAPLPVHRRAAEKGHILVLSRAHPGSAADNGRKGLAACAYVLFGDQKMRVPRHRV